MRSIAPGDQDLRPEPPRLLERAARQLLSGDARWEAEVVLDPRRGAGLPAGRLALDHDRAQSLRGAVHRSRQSCRARADDHRVVLGRVRLGVEIEQLGDSPWLRAHDGLAVDDADHRAVGLGWQRAAPLLDRVVRVGLEPGERDLVAVEEAPQLGARGVPAVAHDDRPRRRRLRGDARESARPAHTVPGERSDGFDELRLLSGDRVVVVRLDPHHPRRL
jgi:hypothetical protein